MLIVIGGCYEGYLIAHSKYDDAQPKLHFADSSAFTTLRALAVHEDFLAVAGDDERIRIIKFLPEPSDVGLLMGHNAPITDLAWLNSSILVSASEDSTIRLWDITNSSCIYCSEVLAAKGITSIAIHPSGKVLLSAGRDKAVRTFEIKNFRQIFVKNFNDVPRKTRFISSHFFVLLPKKLEVYSLNSPTSVSVDMVFNDCCFALNEYIIAGENSQFCNVFNLQLGLIIRWKACAHNARIRCVSADDTQKLAVAFSDGNINVFDLNKLPKEPTLLFCIKNNDIRFTCLTILDYMDETNHHESKNDAIQITKEAKVMNVKMKKKKHSRSLKNSIGKTKLKMAKSNE